TGRCAARAAPWEPTLTVVSAAAGGAKRMTVPAFPTSTLTSAPGRPGATCQEGAGPAGCASYGTLSVIVAPRAVSAARISSVSRACNGPAMIPGPSARAASTEARLCMDLEPGTDRRARTGPVAAGAGQRPAA